MKATRWWHKLYCRLFARKLIAIDKGTADGDYTCEMEYYKVGDKIIITNYSLYKEAD